MDELVPLLMGASLLAAVAVGALVWSFRNGLQRRFEHDVAWLDETRLLFTPNVENSRHYVFIAYIIQCVCFLPLLHFIIPVPFLGIVLWLCLWFLPQKVADISWNRRLMKIDEQLPQTIQKFAGLCGAGLSAADALQQLAAETKAPIQYEYRIMAREWDMGADLAAIVESATQRLNLESFRMFAAVVSVNIQMGGNLVKALEELSGSLSAQLEMRREINAALSEGKMNVYGLLMAPPIMLGIVCFIDLDAVKMFFSTTLGLGIFSGAMLLIGGGSFWAKRIASIRI